MSNQTYDYPFQLLLIGNGNVGKSSLFLRFEDNTWNNNFLTTIGPEILIKININGVDFVRKFNIIIL